jgi:hypothetical protein
VKKNDRLPRQAWDKPSFKEKLFKKCVRGCGLFVSYQAIYARNTKLSLQGIWGYWAGEFGTVNVGSTILGDSAAVFPVHTTPAIDDPLVRKTASILF